MDDPVSIRVIEWNIIDRGFDEGWVVAVPPEREPARRWRSLDRALRALRLRNNFAVPDIR